MERSIAVRNSYVDPLSFLQVELLARLRQKEGKAKPGAGDREKPLYTTLLVINGMAAGRRKKPGYAALPACRRGSFQSPSSEDVGFCSFAKRTHVRHGRIYVRISNRAQGAPAFGFVDHEPASDWMFGRQSFFADTNTYSQAVMCLST
jgi:Phosphoenolpyruvate carboxylase